ncbi:MAG: VWA domain-containing protein [archaeon]|nr:MAG: VWA domain-containing protein [archaeon]
MKKLKQKRGYFFTLDALFALVILLSVIILVPFAYVGDVPEKHRTSYLQEDMLTLLSNLNTVSINNSLINGNISQLNNSVRIEILEDKDNLIDTIGKIWATHYGQTPANNISGEITESFFDSITTEEDNIGLYFEAPDPSGTVLIEIWSKSNIPFANSRDVVAAKKHMSGIAYEQPVKGYSSRAYLYRPEKTKYVYFGGYVGDGNITQRFDLPLDINVTSLSFEGVIMGDTFQISVNDRLFPETFSPSTCKHCPISLDGGQFPDPIDPYFNGGINEIKFNTTTYNRSLYIAGGFLKIKYTTGSVSYLLPETKYLPFINGSMNIYDSFYIPGNLTNVVINLEYEQEENTTPFVKIGNVTVWRDERGNKKGYNSVQITNSTISSKLLSEQGITYLDISKENVPFRVGIEEIEAQIGGRGPADVIVVMDVSGSMIWRMDKDYKNGDQNIACGNLSDPDNPIFLPGRRRLNVAKCLAIEFLNILLEHSENRVGLVGYSARPGSTPGGATTPNVIQYSTGLTNNNVTLVSDLNGYATGGDTPVCAGLRKARLMLEARPPEEQDRPSFILVLADGLTNVHCNETDIDRVDPGCISERCPDDDFCEGVDCGVGCHDRVAQITSGQSAKVAVTYDLRGNGKWNLVVGDKAGNVYGHEWNGLRWVLTPSVISGLSNLGSNTYPAPELLYEFSGTNKHDLIFGLYNGSFAGFSWDGDSWVSNSTLVGGLTIASRTQADPTVVFNLTGNGKWVLISGMDDGSFASFFWNGTGWERDDSLAPPGDIGTNSAPTTGFNITGTGEWELVTGSSGSDYYGFFWNGTGWTRTDTIAFGLDLSDAPGGQGPSPDLAYNLIENKWYIISGITNSHTQGFYSHYYSSSASSWLMICGDWVNQKSIDQSISEATRGHNTANATIYAVGFGPIAFCPIAQDLMMRIAEEGEGDYFLSNNASELRIIFREWAQEILRLTYANQSVIIVIGSAKSNLSNGTVTFGYDFEDNGWDTDGNSLFGDLISYETDGFSGGMDSFTFATGDPFEASVISYSGDLWSRESFIQNTTHNLTFFNLTKWNETYITLGDPFTINIPVERISKGPTVNEVGLVFGTNSSYNETPPDDSSKIIYTLFIPPTFSYSGAVNKVGEGCIWTIQYQDPSNPDLPGGTFELAVPAGTNPTETCTFSKTLGPPNIKYDEDEAYDVAVFNLLNDILDQNPKNNMSDIQFNTELGINAVLVPGIPFLHFTIAKTMAWR